MPSLSHDTGEYATASRRSAIEPSLRSETVERIVSGMNCESRVVVSHVRSSSVDAATPSAQRLPSGSAPWNNGKRDTDVRCDTEPTFTWRYSGSACIITIALVSTEIAAGFRGE